MILGRSWFPITRVRGQSKRRGLTTCPPAVNCPTRSVGSFPTKLATSSSGSSRHRTSLLTWDTPDELVSTVAKIRFEPAKPFSDRQHLVVPIDGLPLPFSGDNVRTLAKLLRSARQWAVGTDFVAHPSGELRRLRRGAGHSYT